MRDEASAASAPPASAPPASARAAVQASRANIGTLPNLLGVFRIAATPAVLALALSGWSGAGLAAGVLFTIAALTDILDGRIARSRGQVSPLGTFMDLAADKVLVAGTLVILVELGLLAGWIAATILIREFVVQAVRQLAAAEDVVIGARSLGKAKTALTYLGILLLLLARDGLTGGPLAGIGAGHALQLAGGSVMVVATAVTVASGWLYLRAAWPLLQRSA